MRPSRPPLELKSFTPYRFNQLAAELSERLADIYRDRFDLDISEWRVLVTLGPDRCTRASAIAQSTRMYKSRVSRAVSNLEQRGLLHRIENEADRREAPLQLTAQGRRLYDKLVPLALEREQALLSRLSAEDRAALMQGLNALETALELASGRGLQE